MQLFDPRGKFNEPPRSTKDAEHARLMAEARERKRLADRTPEQVAEDAARQRREWEANILDGLEGDERKKRETLLMHRRGEYRLTERQRAYQRRKKRNWRTRERVRGEAAAAQGAGAARAAQEVQAGADRERALAFATAQLTRQRKAAPGASTQLISGTPDVGTKGAQQSCAN